MQTEIRPSGRSGSFIEAARRAQIIDAAIAAVNELGYPGASLAQIARRAGISKSVISYHFDGKDELLLQLVDEVFARAGAEIEAAVRAEATPSAKLAAYIRSYLGHMSRHREAMIAAMEIIVSHRDADGVPMYLKEGEEDTALLRAVIGAGMATGEFRRLELQVAVTTISHAVDGALMRSQMHPDTDLVAWAEELVPLLLAALRPDSTGPTSDA